MSCNSAIYTVNNQGTEITTTAGTFAMIPLGSVVRRKGKRLQMNGGSIMAYGSGYFGVDVSCTLAPTETGVITIQLFQEGTPISGANASRTVTTAGNLVPLSIAALVRNCGCDCNSTLEVGVNGSCTVDNLAVRAENK